MVDTRTHGHICYRPERYRNWCFTLNNPTNYEVALVMGLLEDRKAGYIIAYETGEQGTPHLQGYMELPNPVNMGGAKRLVGNRAHVEVRRRTRYQAWNYCRKDGEFYTNLDIKPEDQDLPMIKIKGQGLVVDQWAVMHSSMLSKYKETKWKDWQKELIDIVNGEPDDRTIHWYWEEKGGVGKTYLMKYLYLLSPSTTMIAAGKKEDIFNAVTNMRDRNLVPRVVLVDVPRCNSKYVSYAAMEKLKDGCLYSGKYQGGTHVFTNVHVIAVANVPPDLEKMSKDRWRVIEIPQAVEAAELGFVDAPSDDDVVIIE